MPGDDLGHHLAFFAGLVGEHRHAGAVADGEDIAGLCDEIFGGPAVCVIGMGVSEHGTLDRLPRVDVKIALSQYKPPAVSVISEPFFT